MMTTCEVLPRLESLIRLGLDAVCAYNQALRLVDEPEIRIWLICFREDHERHISELASTLHRLGGRPPNRTLKTEDSEDIEGALHGLKTYEDLMNQSYTETLALELPGEARGIVRRNHDSERRHLQFIEQTLVTRFWESARQRVA